MIGSHGTKSYIPRAQIDLEVEDQQQEQPPPRRSYDGRTQSREQIRAQSRQGHHTQPKDTLDQEINRSLDPTLQRRPSQLEGEYFSQKRHTDQDIPNYKQSYLKNVNPPPGMESRILRDFDRKGYAPVVGSAGLQMLKPKSLQPSSMYRLNMVQAPGLAAPPNQAYQKSPTSMGD